MKRRLLTVKIVAFLLTSAPQFAHANLGDWLDKLEGLSGPGPFHGYSAQIDVWCREVSHPASTKLISPGAPVNGLVPVSVSEDWLKVERKLESGDLDGLDLIPGGKVTSNWLCTGDPRGHRYRIGVLAGLYHTDKVPYTYSPDQQKPVVRARPVAVTYDQSLPLFFRDGPRAHRSLDVGASLGVLVLDSSRKDEKAAQFHTFRVLYAELPRLTVRPLALFCNSDCTGHWNWRDALQLEVFYRFIGSVTPEQFGALSGEKSGFHAHPGFRAGLSWKFRGSAPK